MWFASGKENIWQWGQFPYNDTEPNVKFTIPLLGGGKTTIIHVHLKKHKLRSGLQSPTLLENGRYHGEKEWTKAVWGIIINDTEVMPIAYKSSLWRFVEWTIEISPDYVKCKRPLHPEPHFLVELLSLIKSKPDNKSNNLY